MSQQSHKRSLILASSSPFRRILLERLGLPFEIQSPDIDESALVGESPGALVTRLAAEKARVVAAIHPEAVVIGSDQVATDGDQAIGKPGNAANAIAQLCGFSGRSVHFLSALAVTCAQTGFLYERTVTTEVVFRSLTVDEVQRYVDLERPFNCAGSFKSERAGITLFRKLLSEDPTALVGLPLIALSEALRRTGFDLP